MRACVCDEAIMNVPGVERGLWGVIPMYPRPYISPSLCSRVRVRIGTHRNGDICREISWEKHMETGKYWGHKRTGDL